jgi:ATP-dependent DNA ligase
MEEIQRLPSLYQINAKGKVYEWIVKVVSDVDKYYLQTEHGVLNGNMVIHFKEIPRGKGKKTIEEQAIFEATSLWTEKKRKGYNETIQQAVNVQLHNVPSASQTQIQTQSILVGNKEENDENNQETMKEETNKVQFYPMLANTFEWEMFTKKKIEYPVMVQRKYDGIRCWTRYNNGEDLLKKQIVLTSRNATEFNNFEHIRDALHTWYQWIRGRTNKQIYFDGELYTDALPFEQISGLTRMKEGLNVLNQQLQRKIEYHIYDCYVVGESNMGFAERNRLLAELYGEYPGSGTGTKNHIVLVPTYVVNNHEELRQHQQQFIEEGYEGIMIRVPGGKYEPKKRSKYLLKYKEFMEEEYEICGYHEGTGDDIGTVIWHCRMNGGQEFGVKPRGTREERRKMLEEASKYMGKKLTVIYQELTNDGVPRFPVGKCVRDYE